MAGARIEFLEDGTPFAPDYDDVYRSRSGASQASRVFVDGNNVPERAKHLGQLAILETGFGFGFNCAATLEALRPLGTVSLVYCAIELHPVAVADMTRIHRRRGAASDRLLAEYATLLQTGVASFQLDGLDARIELVVGDGAEALSKIDGPFDALYLDGFAPDRNPGLWNADVFSELARMSCDGTTLATYTVARSVRNGLTTAGFEVRKAPGFGAKRHRLEGRYLTGR